MNTAVVSSSWLAVRRGPPSHRRPLLTVTAFKAGERRAGGVGAVRASRGRAPRACVAPGRGSRPRRRSSAVSSPCAPPPVAANRPAARRFRQDLLHLVENLQHALTGVVVLQGMTVGEPGNRREAFVPLRVVLHRARAERVEVSCRSTCCASTGSRNGESGRSRPLRGAAAAPPRGAPPVRATRAECRRARPRPASDGTGGPGATFRRSGRWIGCCSYDLRTPSVWWDVAWQGTSAAIPQARSRCPRHSYQTERRVPD